MEIQETGGALGQHVQGLAIRGIDILGLHIHREDLEGARRLGCGALRVCVNSIVQAAEASFGVWCSFRSYGIFQQVLQRIQACISRGQQCFIPQVGLVSLGP